MGDWEEDAPEPPKRVATARFNEAKERRDLVALSEVLSDIATGRLAPKDNSEKYDLAIAIRKLKGTLEHSDVRGWRRSGKISKDEVAMDCRRALEAMGQKCGSMDDAEEAYGRGRQQNGKPATLKRIPTGEFLVRIRNCTGNNGKR